MKELILTIDVFRCQSQYFLEKIREERKREGRRCGLGEGGAT